MTTNESGTQATHGESGRGDAAAWVVEVLQDGEWVAKTAPARSSRTRFWEDWNAAVDESAAYAQDGYITRIVPLVEDVGRRVGPPDRRNEYDETAHRRRIEDPFAPARANTDRRAARAHSPAQEGR